MQRDDSEFQFVIYSKEAISTMADDKIEQVYNFWKLIWQEAYQEIGKPELLKMDLFLRQNYIAALFYKNDIVGSHFYEIVDLNKKIFSEAGPMKEIFNAEFVKTAQNMRKRTLMVLAQFAVSKMWRRSVSGLNMADIFTMVAAKFAQTKGYSALAGSTRNTRGVNKILERGSAHLICKDYLICDEPSDLILFELPYLPKADGYSAGLAEKLWLSIQIDGQIQGAFNVDAA